MYDYNAKVVAVIDGDTVTLDIDLGFGVRRVDKFRLYGPDVASRDGMNAPEMNTPEGKAARQFLFDLVGESPIVTVKTVKERHLRQPAAWAGRMVRRARWRRVAVRCVRMVARQRMPKWAK
jgi:endonuclease YncB( thermonuclease family)